MSSSKVLPKALLQSEIPIGNLIIPCAVLDNSERIISVRGFSNYLGVKGGGAYWEKKKIDLTVLPEFVSAQYLQPFITDEVKELLIDTITYTALNGQSAQGLKAKIIPKICDVWIKARNAGALNQSQEKIAEKAYLLLSAFSEIGIVALIDEYTGYDKQKHDYQKILELYIAKEISPWIKTFDENYYKQLYRLQGWNWDAFKNKKNHPQYIGKLTNRLIYEKLAPGVLQELQKINPRDSKGNRPTKHHQRLTENYGYRELLKLISAITILMEQFSDGQLVGAIQKIDARFPTLSTPTFQTVMDFPAIADKKTFDSVIKLASRPVITLGETKE